jgi:hypothetical protein
VRQSGSDCITHSHTQEGTFLSFYIIPNGEQCMKKTEEWKTAEFIQKIPGVRLTAKEKDTLQAAVRILNEQNEQLGLLDPLDAEPATIFFADVEKR